MHATLIFVSSTPNFRPLLSQEYELMAEIDPVKKTENMERSLRTFFEKQGYDLSLKALDLGAKFHKGVRKDKVTPEFSHPLTVTQFLKSLGNTVKDQADHLLSVAILHDTVEDYPQALKEMIEFPTKVKKDVVLLSKVRGQRKLDTGGYYTKLATSPAAAIVKSLDRLHNVKTMKPFKAEKKQEYLRETLEFVFPMMTAASKNFSGIAKYMDRIKRSIKREFELVFAKDGLELPEEFATA